MLRAVIPVSRASSSIVIPVALAVAAACAGLPAFAVFDGLVLAAAIGGTG